MLHESTTARFSSRVAQLIPTQWRAAGEGLDRFSGGAWSRERDGLRAPVGMSSNRPWPC